MPTRPELPLITAFKHDGLHGHYVELDGWLEVHIAGSSARAELGNLAVEALLPLLKHEASEEARRKGLLPKA